MKIFSPIRIVTSGLGACPVLEQLARQAQKKTCTDAYGRPVKCK